MQTFLAQTAHAENLFPLRTRTEYVVVFQLQFPAGRRVVTATIPPPLVSETDRRCWS